MLLLNSLRRLKPQRPLCQQRNRLTVLSRVTTKDEVETDTYPKPRRYLLYRALGALVPYIVGTWGVRV